MERLGTTGMFETVWSRLGAFLDDLREFLRRGLTVEPESKKMCRKNQGAGVTYITDWRRRRINHWLVAEFSLFVSARYKLFVGTRGARVSNLI